MRPPRPFTLIHIRHGETAWNAEGRLQGQRDTALGPVGELQAARNGRALRRWLARMGRTADEFDWVASPLQRATATMEIMREAMGLDPKTYRTDAALKEISFGDWEGLTLAEVALRDPDGYAARQRDKWRFVPPGGESYADLAERIAGWLDALRRDIVCVTHGGVHRVLRHRLEGLDEDASPLLDVPQDRIYVWSGAVEWV